MKGTFALRPTYSKYHITWGVTKVFNYFRNLPVTSDSTLKKVSLKLAMLLMQTIHLMSLKDIKYVGEQVFISIMQKIKQSKPGDRIYPLSFKTDPKDTKLLVVRCLKRYSELTQD